MTTFNSRRLAFGIVIGGLLLLSPVLQAQAMTVSPVRLELSGDPGTVVSGFFKVINEEKEAKTLYTSFENFEAMGETGSPSFKPAQEGLATWINAPEKIDIESGQTKTIDFSVTIPTTAEPGGYFAAIFLGTNPPSTNPNQLSIGARVGTLVLFRVNGDIKEGAALLDFGTKDKTRWFSALPVNYFYRFQNSGADRVMPKGSVTIRNTFGMKTTTLDANLSQGNVLPRSIRRFELWWQKNQDDTVKPALQPSSQGFFEAIKYEWNNFAFGRYKANLDLSYGSREQKTAASFSIFVFPWQLLSIELVIILLLIFVLWFAIKRYNKFIIKRARRRS